MAAADDPIEKLIQRATAGDTDAVASLLRHNRKRLKQMIAVRLDSRLQARVDPSDVVQETLVEATRRMTDYLRDRPLPFYPWLRRLALDRLERIHRDHIGAQCRSVRREVELWNGLSDDSIQKMASHLCSLSSSPSRRALRSEMRERVQQALVRLPDDDREVLVLRFLEHLKAVEAAAVLGISEHAVRMRQLRALQRLEKLVATHEGGDAP